MKNSEMEHLINEYCSSRRNREILHDRLIDGEKIADIAEKYELSERQVKNIIKKFKALL